MATIASNQLGIYYLDTAKSSPLVVLGANGEYESTAFPSSTVDTDFENAPYYGVAYNEPFIVLQGSTLTPWLFKQANQGANYTTVPDSDFTLVAAATTTTLDTSNTINEVAARDGLGSSTNYIASGAFSYNFSVDGLIDLSSASGSSIDVIDISRNSYYILMRFSTDINGGSNQVSYLGQGLIESASLTGGVDDISTYSATFRGYGGLYKE